MNNALFVILNMLYIGSTLQMLHLMFLYILYIYEWCNIPLLHCCYKCYIDRILYDHCDVHNAV